MKTTHRQKADDGLCGTALSRVLGLIVASSSLLSIGTSAQWQPDMRLSDHPDSTRTSYTNARCVAASGDTIHAVWQDKRAGNWRIFHRRSLDGGFTWTAETPVSTNATASAGYPCIAVSGSHVHILWYDERDKNSEIYYRNSTDAGETWNSEFRLTNDPALSQLPSVAVSGATVHAAWQDRRHGMGEIYYRRSTDAGHSWGEEARMTAHPAISEAPCLAAWNSDVHMVWYDGQYGMSEIMYIRSKDGGSTWSAAARLTDDPAISNGACVAADGRNVAVAWHDIRTGAWDIHFVASTDGGNNWSEDIPLTLTTTAAWFPSVSVSASQMHVVWADDRDSASRIMHRHSSDAGKTWSADIPLTSASLVARYPSVSLTGASVDVIWTDERDGNRKIYFKRNPTGNGPP